MDGRKKHERFYLVFTEKETPFSPTICFLALLIAQEGMSALFEIRCPSSLLLAISDG